MKNIVARNRITRSLQQVSKVWSDLAAGEASLFKGLIVLACLTTSSLIGLTYARTADIQGWQVWSWLGCILLLLIILVPPWSLHLGKSWLVPGSLFLTALMIRLPFLDKIPGGLHVDEVGVAGFALHRLFPSNGMMLNPFFVGPASQPALYHYVIRASLTLFGLNIQALRFSSALVGSLSVVAIYGIVIVARDQITAIITAILMIGSHYHLHWSRLALNNIWDTLWVPMILALYVWGWKKSWSGAAVLAGLGLGLSQYFYAGSKIGIFLVIFVALALWNQQPDEKFRWSFLGKFIVTTMTVAAPIFFFAILNWQTYIHRPIQTWGWSQDAIRVVTGETINIPFYLWHQISRSFGAFTLFPEVTGFYGPGVPFLIGLAAPFFLVGIMLCIFQRQWLPIVWLFLVIFFGGILLAGAPSSSHYVASIPAVCWLTATPLAWIYSNGRPRWALLLLILIVFTDLFFYLGVYLPAGPRDLIHAFPLNP